MLALKTTFGIIIISAVLVYSIGSSKKPKNEKLKRHYEELDEKYDHLEQILNHQAAQLYKVTDGLRTLCQSLEAVPFDPEVTEEPRITATFDDHAPSPSPDTHDLRPLAFSFRKGKQHFVYEVDYEADSQPNIFWRDGSDLVIHDDTRNKIVNKFAKFRGSSKLVSKHKVVQVNIILGPAQYTVDIDAEQTENKQFELDLKPIGIDIGNDRRLEFVPGNIVQFTAEIPKSYKGVQQLIDFGSSFIVMDKSYPPSAKEFRVMESDYIGPFSVHRSDSQNSHEAVFKLDTMKHEMEGLFSVSATAILTNASQPSVALTESQSIVFYQRDRDVPYPDDFVSFIDHKDYLEQPCQEGAPCFVKCKALGKFLGDIHLTREGSLPESVPVENDQFKQWGGVHQAVFTIENFRKKNGGNYTCRARSPYKVAVTQSISVPFYKQATILEGSGILMHNEFKLVFKCIATGYPQVEIQLYKNSNVSDGFVNSPSVTLSTKIAQHDLTSLTLVLDKTDLHEHPHSIGCKAGHAYHSTSRQFEVSPPLK